MKNYVSIVRNNAAIDTTIISKGEVVDGVFNYFGGRLEDIAAIGDELLDLPLLTTPRLGMVGCPANAQKGVIDTVNRLRGYVSPEKVYKGFFDFYEKAAEVGIKLIISDKDGVLKEGGNKEGSERFRQLALEMGQEGKPYVVVLTGSSHQQNLPFMRDFGLDERLSVNPAVRKYPYLLLCENGAIHLNVLTGETRNYVADISPELLKALKGKFESRVRKKIETEVLPFFGFEWSKDYDDQRGKVYHVLDKQSMVTFNVPREFSDGTPYRKTKNADMFRDRVVEKMEETAQELGLPYKIVR